MSDGTPIQKSFSPWKRWGFGLDLVIRTALVLVVVVMVNYLGGRWYQRYYLNSSTRIDLSPRTVGLLKSITNEVKVTLFYDHDHPLYTSISALLNEYRDANPHFHVATVDYLRDAGAAEKIKIDYKNHLAGVTNKNLIIFDCDGRVKIVNGNGLAEYMLEQVPNETEREFRRKPTAFLGEKMFSSALLTVTSPKPLKAYYLTNHGEHRLNGTEEAGYLTFNSVLEQNYIRVETLSLLGTNTVPGDCNLLIIAGPTAPLGDAEREKIDDYLHQGGRLFALLNFASLARPTGLEKVLAGWGVEAGDSTLTDPNNTTGHSDLIALDFSDHPIVNPLIGSPLHLVLPRAMSRLNVGNPPADAPRVEELAFTSPAATAGNGGARTPRRFSLAVAVEKGRVPGVITDRGSTRLVAVGDSQFLDNQMIESACNKDFLGYAINWLLERTQLMQGLGPRPIKEFRLTMTKSQMRATRWILLAGMPGAVLLFGGLVWLRRRT
ncbi:MAG: GldG family protein [Verrucomicrobia bacterium]|nr:GldG family protein [Verrucomicrobiota bacterium]